MTDVAYVAELPECDICKYEDDTITVAHYDGAIRGVSAWAYMCEKHFKARGVGLGLGLGQRLIIETPKTAPAPWVVGAMLANMAQESADREKRAAIQAAVEAGDFDTFEDLIGDGDPAEWL